MNDFDGPALTPDDTPRLSSQLEAVFELMNDGSWRTLARIQAILKADGREASTQSISARLRDLRKDKFGGHTVERRKVDAGLFEYRLLV